MITRAVHALLASLMVLSACGDPLLMPARVGQSLDGVEVSLSGIGGLMGAWDDPGIFITTGQEAVIIQGVKLTEPGGRPVPATVGVPMSIPAFTTQRLPLSWANADGTFRMPPKVGAVAILLEAGGRPKTIDVQYRTYP